MKRILLVEDNKLERKIVTQILYQHFFDQIIIDEASDGSSALRFLSQNIYDLIVTDLVMPNIEGLQLIQIIKKQYPGLNIVAISGSQPFYLYLAKKHGVNDVFTKPLNIERFVHVTGKLLELNTHTALKV